MTKTWKINVYQNILLILNAQTKCHPQEDIDFNLPYEEETSLTGKSHVHHIYLQPQMLSLNNVPFRIPKETKVILHHLMCALETIMCKILVFTSLMRNNNLLRGI